MRSLVFRVILMLLAQYALGMWTNLYANPTASAHHKGLLAAVGNAIAHGPIELAIHAILGIALLLVATVLLARAIPARQPKTLAASALGLAAIIAAAINGDRFAATQNNAASLAMALSAGLALLCYVIVLSTAPSD